MDPLTALDPVALWENARPAAIGILARYGPDLVRAGALRLRDRIWHDPAPAQAAAESNARAYTAAFGAVLDGLRARGQLTEDQLARAVASPAIARVLERAVLAASVTGDEAVHRELARLVAARMRADDDSTLALNLRDAAERVESLNSRHLRVLALVFFVKYGAAPAPDPESPGEAQLDAMLGWIEPRARGLGSPTCTFDEAAHLDGLHLVKFRAAFGHFSEPEYDYSALQQRLNLLLYPGTTITKPEHAEVVRWMYAATSTSTDPTASRMALTPVGTLLGYAAYSDHVGEEPDFSQFDEGRPASTTNADAIAANFVAPNTQ